MALCIIIANCYSCIFLHFDLWNSVMEWGKGKEWIQPILVNFIGGAIGGLLVYRYVMWRERKKEKKAIKRERRKEKRDIKREQERDERGKREKCTTALLATQMDMILQRQSIYGLQKIVESILKSRNLEQTLCEQRNIQIAFAKEEVSFQDLNLEIPTVLTDYIFVQPLADNRIAQLSQIFDIRSISFPEKEKTELASYFRALASCNKKYNDIISQVMRHNALRDHMMLSLANPKIGSAGICNYLSVAIEKIRLGLELNEKISKYEEAFDNAYAQTENYINLLGISGPIQIPRDENGKPNFFKM